MLNELLKQVCIYLAPDEGGAGGGSGEPAGGGDAGLADDPAPGDGTGNDPGNGDGSPAPRNAPPDGFAKWLTQVPADLRPTVQEHLQALGNPQATLGEYIKSYGDRGAELARIKGERRIPIPSHDSDPAVFKEFREKLGIPEEPSGYDIELPELPEGFSYQDDEVEAFRQFAHSAALTKVQAQKIVEWDADRRRREVEARNQSMKEANKVVETKLHDQYGGEWKNKLVDAWKFMEKTPWAGLAKELSTDELGSHPELIDMMLFLHDTFKEGGIPRGGAGFGASGRTGPDFKAIYNSRSMEDYRKEKKR